MKRLVEFDTAIGTANLGDEIILNSLREQMRFLYDECFTMRFATHLPNFPAYKYLAGGQKLDFIRNADYKVIMGTNLLSRDIRRTHTQWVACGAKGWIFEDSVLAGVGTTLGKGKITRYSKRFYARTLRREFIHSVRDEESKEFLESMGFKALNTGCPTLWNLTPEFCKGIPHDKASRVLFSLSGFGVQQDRRGDQALLNVLRQQYNEMFFWCQTGCDEEYLDTFDDVKDIPRIYSLQRFAELLDEGDIDYVGTRLHGGIMALQHKVRTIVIAIDHRARGFSRSNNLVICERDEIPSYLDSMINSSFETRIVIDEDAIKTWKAQFDDSVITGHNQESYDDRFLVRVTRLIWRGYRFLKRRFNIMAWK